MNQKNKKTALLLGSTGLVGTHLLSMLLESPVYKKVCALTRRPLSNQHAKLYEILFDFDHMNNCSKDIFAVDDVFCCLGTTIKKAKTKDQFYKVDVEYPVAIARWMQKAGARQFLVISALGADTNSPFFYNRVKGKLEQELLGLDYACLQIFRPSLLLGKRQEFRLGEVIAGGLGSVVSPFMVGPLFRYKPVKAGVVATAMLRAANSDIDGIHIHESSDIVSMGDK